jgi:hypothetical protein
MIDNRLDRLISLVYVRSATRLMSDEELLAMLREAREENRRLGITGMLLYKGGNYMQVLEGPESAVMTLHERIEKDEQHRGMLVLLRMPIAERQFPDWSIGFCKVDRMDLSGEEGFSPLLTDEFTAEHYRQQPHHAYRLLLTFRDGMT